MRIQFGRLSCCILLFAILLSSCQSTPPAPTGTVTITATAARATRLPTQTRPAPTQTPAPSPTPTLPPHLNVDSAALRGLEVNFWHPWQGDLAERAEDAVNAFNKENEWGVVVRARSFYSPSGLSEALRNTGQADSPEMTAALPEQLSEWQRQARMVDLNDYTVSQDWGLTASQISDFHPVFWDQELGPGGQRSGIPALRTARVLFYNQTWASELGFNQAPTTPADFQAQACAAAIYNNDPNRYDKRGTGGWLSSGEALTTLSWMQAFGAQPIPAQEGQPYRFQSVEAGRALEFLHGLFEKGCAWEALRPTPHDYFAQRMALFYTGSLQDLNLQARAQETANSGDSWTIIPFPAAQGRPLALTTGYSYGLLASTPEKQMAAWLFLRYLLEPRNQALMAEVWPSLPLTDSATAMLADYKQSFPWFMILPLKDSLKPAPALASWRLVRGVVEDATWQVFHLPADQMNVILPQMDVLTKEILADLE